VLHMRPEVSYLAFHSIVDNISVVTLVFSP
jgi:hypothetical protein